MHPSDTTQLIINGVLKKLPFDESSPFIRNAPFTCTYFNSNILKKGGFTNFMMFKVNKCQDLNVNFLLDNFIFYLCIVYVKNKTIP